MLRLLLTLLIIGSVALGASSAWTQDKTPDGTVRISSGSVAAGVLTYQGKEHPFSVSGLSVADVGISQAEATGEVYVQIVRHDTGIGV